MVRGESQLGGFHGMGLEIEASEGEGSGEGACGRVAGGAGTGGCGRSRCILRRLSTLHGQLQAVCERLLMLSDILRNGLRHLLAWILHKASKDVLHTLMKGCPS